MQRDELISSQNHKPSFTIMTFLRLSTLITLLLVSNCLVCSCFAYSTLSGGNDTVGLTCNPQEIYFKTKDIIRAAATELENIASSIVFETNTTSDVPAALSSFSPLQQHSSSNVRISTSMNGDVPQVGSIDSTPLETCKQNRRVLRDVLNSTLHGKQEIECRFARFHPLS